MVQTQNDKNAATMLAEAGVLRSQIKGDGNLADQLLTEQASELEMQASMIEDCERFTREHELERLREAGIIQ